jgi:hypothetical protein
MATVTYTPEVCKRIIQEYEAKTPVEQIATTLGVPARSVIAKLSSLGVYRRKTYLNKQGEPPERKSEILDRLAVLLGVEADQLESLEKANKWVLLLLERHLQS